jgi:hypothetical protein
VQSLRSKQRLLRPIKTGPASGNFGTLKPYFLISYNGSEAYFSNACFFFLVT